MNKKKSNQGPHSKKALIASNKKAYHDYHVSQTIEAGLVLEGWEVKSIRAGRIQLKDSYVIFQRGEAWLIGAHFSPLPNVPNYLHPDPSRTRKLLLQQREIGKLLGATQKEGFTVIPLNLHWKQHRVKVDIALGKGKKIYDKRETIKRRDWEREKHRVLKNH